MNGANKQPVNLSLPKVTRFRRTASPCQTCIPNFLQEVFLLFKIFRKNCCGLDIHKTWIYACIGITDPNGLTEYLKPLLVQIANALIKSKKHPEF